MNRLYPLSSVLLAVLLSTVTVTAEEYTFDFQRIVDIDERPHLDLRFVNGSVNIVGGAGDRIIIDAVKSVRATDPYEAEEVAAHIEIKVRQEGREVRVETNYLRMLNRSRSFWDKVLGTGDDSYGDVKYTISVPIDCDISIGGAAGTVALQDIAGDVSISVTGADIHLTNVEGEVDINNLVGNTKVEYLIGPITVSQPEGKIDLEWIDGNIRLKSVTSEVSIRQVRGALDLVSQTGEVSIRTELDSRNDYFVETVSGPITFSIPESASAVLHLESETGRISTDVPVAVESMSRTQLIGRRGNGGVSVTLSSRSGDVIVGLY